MPDYNLGRASGKIEILYDGSGADRAEKGLDDVAASSTKADESLSKTQKTLGDTDRQMRTSGDSAQGYSARLGDVKKAADEVEAAHKHLNSTLLDVKSTTDDIDSAYDRLDSASKRHTKTVDAERDAHKAWFGELSIGQRIVRSFSDIIPNLSRNVQKLGSAQDAASNKASGLAKALNIAAIAATALGQPEIAVGIKAAGAAMDKVGGSAKDAAGSTTNLIGTIAGFEMAFAKISGLTLAVPSVAGLAGLAGAAGVQGIVEMVGAVEQLSGVLGLLPSVVAGAGFAMETLQVAFHGVGDALKDMMADDPKKFLEDIKNMGPAAAHSMLQIAQFRDMFKLAGGAIQDSFFAQIAEDIAPLIQTWLPALTAGMSQVAGIFGQAAHQVAELLQQPQAMAVFQRFVDDISAGLQAMIPALDPLLYMFEQLTVAGSGFFAQIGGDLTRALSFFADLIEKAASSGKLQQWIQDGINAFERLGNILFSTGSAFLNIMDVAERFGGGGLLGWLQQITSELANWTQTADGQKSLTGFFSTLRTATDAFTPMLGPILNGLASLGKAFVDLGIATAPGWQTVFNTFAATMQQLAPIIVGMAPAVNTFLTGLANAFAQLVATVGPQLPGIFKSLADSFVALLPQIQPLTLMFLDLAQRVGPQLPKLFAAITDVLVQMQPYWPIVIDFVRIFVSTLTWFLDAGATVIHWFSEFLDGIKSLVTGLPGELNHIGIVLGDFFANLPGKALQWGKDLINGFIGGIRSMSGQLIDAIKSNVTDLLPDFVKKALGIASPSRVFHDIGVYMMQGLQQGIAAGGGGVLAAAAGIVGQVTAQSRAGAAGAVGGGGAPPAGGAGYEGGALLPNNIAGADTSILGRYLQHQFPENRGLAGLAKDMGQLLQVFQSGLNLVTQNLMQPLGQVLGMVPGLKAPTWQKMTPEKFAAQQTEALDRQAAEKPPKATWGQVNGTSDGASPGVATPLGLTPSSSKAEFQKAVIAAGKARGMSDAAIQTALAVAGAESDYGQNPAFSTQGGHYVGGAYQQGPAFGTQEQVKDPNYAINAFYDAFAKQLASSPDNPLLAAVLTQNPQLGGSAPGSDYMRAVQAQLGGANSVMDQYSKGVKGPSWAQITGGSPAAAAAAAITGGAGAAQAGYAGDAALLAGVPAGRYVRPGDGLDFDLAKGLADCSSAVEDLTNMMDSRPTGGRSLSTHNADQWLTDRGFLPTDTPVPGAFNVGFNPSHMQATLPGGTNFNWGSNEAAAARGINGTGAFDPAFTSHYYRPVGASSPGVGNSVAHPSTGYPDVDNALSQIRDNTQKSATTNDRLLQSYLAGNPALASQIDAAKTPGAPDEQVLGTLNSITSTITGLKAQDPVGNKNTIDALTSTQNQIAQNAGFQQGASPAQMFGSIASGAAGIAGSVIQSIQAGLDAITATQDIADRLVYGLRNFEDVNKIVDDVQKWITLGANIAGTVGTVLSTISGFVGAGGSADPSGGASGAAAALGMAGQIAQLISAAYQGVNAAIDFGQQIYHIAGQYVGRFLSVMTGLNGTPLMGDVRLQLNKNTGQLIAYSQDNPENKDYLHVPSWMNKTYDYNGRGNEPQVNAEYNLYAGPGTSPRELFSAATWYTTTGGSTGAMAAVNF